MATTKLGDNEVHTNGDLPSVGSHAPDFVLTKNDLSAFTSLEQKGKRVILNIFPSIDTGVCATSVRKFNQEAAKLDNTLVLCISQDLPFAHKRFCGAEGIENVITLSGFRNPEFQENYGVKLMDSAMKGLCARAVVVADENGKVLHSELVPSIGQEPDYEAALAVLN